MYEWSSVPYVAVGTVEEALQQLETNRFSALVTDYRIHNRLGTEVLARFRETHPQEPAILMSGSDATLQGVAADLGAAFYQKPPSLKDILEHTSPAS